jgi:hypothetical protein
MRNLTNTANRQTIYGANPLTSLYSNPGASSRGRASGDVMVA